MADRLNIPRGSRSPSPSVIAARHLEWQNKLKEIFQPYGSVTSFEIDNGHVSCSLCDASLKVTRGETGTFSRNPFEGHLRGIHVSLTT